MHRYDRNASDRRALRWKTFSPALIAAALLALALATAPAGAASAADGSTPTPAAQEQGVAPADAGTDAGAGTGSNGGAADPSATGAGTTGSGTADPGTTGTGAADPGTTGSGTADPGTTGSGTADPGTTGSGTADPGTTNPGTTDPATPQEPEDPAPKVPADVPLAPQEVLDLLQVAYSGTDEAKLPVTGTLKDANLRLWVRSDDSTVHAKNYSTSALVLSTSFQTDDDGTIKDQAPASGLAFSNLPQDPSDSAIRHVYLQLKRDVTYRDKNGTAAQYKAGQVLRVDVRKDDAEPTATVEACGSDGVTPLTDLSNYHTGGHRVTTYADEPITFKVTPADDVSGIATNPVDSVRVYVAGYAKPLVGVRNDDGSVTFTLSRTGKYDLTTTRVEVKDVAGNTTTSYLGDLPIFKDKGITTYRVFGNNEVQVSARAKGATDGIYYTDKGSVALSVRIDDPDFADMSDEEKAAVTYTVSVDGGAPKQFSMDPDKVVNGYSFRTDLDGLGADLADGTHTIKVTYSPAGWIRWERSSEATVVVDSADPTVANAQVTGGIKEDNVATVDGVRLLAATGTSATVEVADATSGVKEVKVTAVCKATPDDASGKTVTLLDARPGNATSQVVTIPFSQDGRYDLADVAIEVTDAAGRTATTKLADVPCSTQAADGTTAQTPASQAWNVVGIVVDKVSNRKTTLYAKTPAGIVERQSGTFVEPASALVVRVANDPWLGVLSKTKAFAGCVTGSVTNVAADSTTGETKTVALAADQLAASSFQRQGSSWDWTYEVPFLRTDSKLADGRYEFRTASPLDTANATYLVDTTAPQVTDVDVPDAPADEIAQVASTGIGQDVKVLAGSSREVRVRVQDLLPGATSASGMDQDDASGVDPSSIEVVAHYATSLGGAADHQMSFSQDQGNLEVDEQSGWVTLRLEDDGLYPMSGFEVSAKDGEGNALSSFGLGSSTSADALGFGAILVDASEQDHAVSVTVGGKPGQQDSAENPVYAGGGAQVCVTVSDPWFPVHSKLQSMTPTLNATVTNASGLKAVDSDADAPANFTNEGGSNWVLVVPYERVDATGAVSTAADAVLPDGSYAVSFSYGRQQADCSFRVDSTAPKLTDVVVKDAAAGPVANDKDNARKVLVGGQRQIELRVEDLLPKAPGQEADYDGRTNAAMAASGVDPQTIKVSVAYAKGDQAGAPQDQASFSLADGNLTVVDQGNGYYSLELDEEGLYPLASVRIEAKDHCGNELQTTVGDFAQAAGTWGYDNILVWRGEAKPKATVALRDVPQEGEDSVPTSKNPYYHRCDVVADVTVTDPWLQIVRALSGSGSTMLGGTFKAAGESTEQTLAASRSLADLAKSGDKDDYTTYTATLTLPRSKTSKTLPAEGDYVLDLTYAGVGGYVGGDPAYDRQQVSTFGVDYTAPSLGRLVLSQTSPFPRFDSGKQKDQPWGVIFSTSAEEGTLAVTDNLSGVAGESLSLTTDGQEGLTRQYADGAVTFAFEGEGRRLSLDQTSIAIEDAAGNRAETGALSAYANSNIPQGAHVVAIDEVAPVITVSYDNNDVRNGKYYNRGRVATVSVEEANFDLLQNYAPDTLVASSYRDGSDYSDSHLAAKDLKPVTGSDGVVRYVGTLEFADDADWRLGASFTDGGDHASNVLDQSFVVDTVAPALMVTYDNDDVRNAMYYKAPRTATIKVMDKNFSPELGAIDSSSISGGPAPSTSGWTETEPRQEWAATSHFGGETHYQLKVSVSDLAGNTTDAYDSGEFVIDMTAPQVVINGVEDHTAYAGDVVPTTTWTDTNLDTLGSNYTLVGARKGDDTFYGLPAETESATQKTENLGNVPYELEYDDVYTMSSEAVDLAGNTATTGLTFSVNRFGSTYYMDKGSENVPGAFLSSPQQVQVVEVNVSGLKTDTLHAELAQDDSSHALQPGTDYQIDPNQPDRGWSATVYTFPANLFEDDGYYRISLTSTDQASQLSQNGMEGKGAGRQGTFPVSFAVDQTDPTAQLVGVSPNGVYLDPQKTATLDAGDNMELAEVHVYQDDAEVLSLGPDDLEGDATVLHLAADGTPHTYRVEARDKAGNIRTQTYGNVVATGDLLTYILHTPQLMANIAAGGVVLLGAIAAIAYLAVRRHRMTERQRNPFEH